jgi:hypothetical protein
MRRARTRKIQRSSFVTSGLLHLPDGPAVRARDEKVTRVAEDFPRHLVGVGVPRVDHAMITTEDPATLERFYQEVILHPARAQRAVHHGPDLRHGSPRS